MPKVRQFSLGYRHCHLIGLELGTQQAGGPTIHRTPDGIILCIKHGLMHRSRPPALMHVAGGASAFLPLARNLLPHLQPCCADAWRWAACGARRPAAAALAVRQRHCRQCGADAMMPPPLRRSSQPAPPRCCPAALRFPVICQTLVRSGPREGGRQRVRAITTF